MIDLRRVEIFEDGEWKEVMFKDLKKGVKMRLFDGDKPVVMEETTEWIAASDPYVRDDGLLTIECEIPEVGE